MKLERIRWLMGFVTVLGMSCTLVMLGYTLLAFAALFNEGMSASVGIMVKSILYWIPIGVFLLMTKLNEKHKWSDAWEKEEEV